MQLINLFQYIFRLLWNEDKKNKRLIVLSVFFGIFFIISNISIPVVLRCVINSLNLPNSQEIVILAIVACYGLTWIFSQLMFSLRSIFLFRPMHRASGLLVLNFYRHILSLPLCFHLDKKIGNLLNALEQAQIGVPKLINGLLWQVIPLTIEAVAALIIIGWMYGIVYAAMVVTILCLYLLCAFFTVQQSIKYQTISNEKERAVSAYLYDTICNYETIKYFNNDVHEIKQCTKILREKEDAGTHVDVRMSIISLTQMLILGFGLTSVTLFAGHNIFQHKMQIGDFVLLNSYLLQFSLPLSYFFFVIREIKQSLTQVNYILDILAIKSKINSNENTANTDLEISNIKFQNVNFSYDGKREIIKNLTLDIPHGKTIAIVGTTGSGKSTLAKLIFRFFDVSSGNILINNTDIKSLNLHELRSTIGIVPQDTILFNNTLRYNITYGDLIATESDVAQVVYSAGLTDFIAKLPLGLDTIVGERGLKLSGGEKQRVAIARMLLKKPSIYIFDEATSSLDTQTEKQIQRNIEEISKNKTSFIIAHRLSTIVNADEIIVMNLGAIVEKGHHNELLKLNGYYAKMWSAQSISNSINIGKILSVEETNLGG